MKGVGRASELGVPAHRPPHSPRLRMRAAAFSTGHVPLRLARLLVVVVRLPALLIGLGDPTERQLAALLPAGRLAELAAALLAEFGSPAGSLELEHGVLRVGAVQAHLVAVLQAHRLAGLQPTPLLVRRCAPPRRVGALRVHIDARAVFARDDDDLLWIDVHRLPVVLHHVVATQRLLHASLQEVLGFDHARSAVPGEDMPNHLDGRGARNGSRRHHSRPHQQRRRRLEAAEEQGGSAHLGQGGRKDEDTFPRSRDRPTREIDTM
eukprot:5648185-Prymnesium_polylepis.1